MSNADQTASPFGGAERRGQASGLGLQGCHLHVDCASGAAGDMMLGALIDLGVPLDAIGDALDAIGAGRQRLTATRIVKHGIASIDVKVDTAGELTGMGGHQHGHGRSHGHDHTHEDPRHRAHVHYADIRARIAAAKLPIGVKTRARDIFDRLARAEAKLHGSTVDDVAFHEVGAIDSVVDIVGTAAALAWLAPVSVTCASVAMGSGTLTCAHGVLPVPAPAALEVMREAGGIMADGGVAQELCTPTGAAILASAVTAWTPAPVGRALAVGFGAGDSELEDRANVLRAIAMTPTAVAADHGVWQLEANLDDMSPELCGPAADAAFAAGALDVWWSAITMKKGRPALTLFALVPDIARDAVIAAIVLHTTTIGVRYTRYERHVVPRTIVTVDTRFGPIAVKVAGTNAAPEFEACAAAARTHGVPVKQVFAEALTAYARRAT